MSRFISYGDRFLNKMKYNRETNSNRETELHRTRKKEHTRKTIIAEAEKFFSEKSYQDVFLEDIAKSAFISRATLYNYFKNKDDVFFAVANSVYKNENETIAGILSEEVSGKEQVLLLCERIFKNSFNNPISINILGEFWNRLNSRNLKTGEIYDTIAACVGNTRLMAIIEGTVELRTLKLKDLISDNSSANSTNLKQLFEEITPLDTVLLKKLIKDNVTFDVAQLKEIFRDSSLINLNAVKNSIKNDSKLDSNKIKEIFQEIALTEITKVKELYKKPSLLDISRISTIFEEPYLMEEVKVVEIFEEPYLVDMYIEFLRNGILWIQTVTNGKSDGSIKNTLEPLQIVEYVTTLVHGVIYQRQLKKITLDRIGTKDDTYVSNTLNLISLFLDKNV